MKLKRAQFRFQQGAAAFFGLVLLVSLVIRGLAPTRLASAASLNATPTPVEPTSLPPDKLENNWNARTAAPIAPDVIYDLNFVCPVSWGCAGGDHDYLHLPVKRGLHYLIATFDLGPGVDTVLDLFWGSEDTPIANNDDAVPGHGFLSVIRWVAPADGTAVIRVAPRTGGTNPIVFDDRASTYRFAVALAGSDLARQVEQRIAEQTAAPAASPSARGQANPAIRPTPVAPAPPPVAAPVSSVAPAPGAPVASGGLTGPTGLTAKGPAIVQASTTAFRIAPNPNASLIATLAAGTNVTLIGQYSGLWVSVTTADSVLPGWVLGTDLRRLVPGQATPVISSTATLPASTPPVSTGATAIALPTSISASAIRVRPIAPILAAPAPAVPLRSSLTISVTVQAAPPRAMAARSRSATPIPTAGQPLAGLRVQLVDTFGQLLAEGITGADGGVALTHDVMPNQRLVIRLPAAGLDIAVDPGQPEITIAIPTGALP